MSKETKASPWPDEFGQLLNMLRLCEPGDLELALRWLKEATEQEDREQKVWYAVAVAWQNTHDQHIAQELREACDRIRGVLGVLEEVVKHHDPVKAMTILSERIAEARPQQNEGAGRGGED